VLPGEERILEFLEDEKILVFLEKRECSCNLEM